MEDAPDGPATEPDAGRPPRTQLAVLLLLAGAALYLLVRLLAPFLPALVTSAVLAVLVYPAYRPFERRTLRQADPPRLARRSVAAFVGTVAVFFLVLIPLVALSLVLVQEIAGSVDWAARQVGRMLGPGGPLRGWVLAVGERLGVDGSRVRASIADQMQGVVTLMTSRTLNFLSGLGGRPCRCGCPPGSTCWRRSGPWRASSCWRSAP